MNCWLLYLFLLKATLTSFSGLASLPVIRSDLVLHRHVLTDEQLNTAVIVSRTTRGPVGIYVVGVGYSAAGVPGAIAGWAAVCTPELLIIPLLRFASRHTEHLGCEAPYTRWSRQAQDSSQLRSFQLRARR